MQPLNQPEEEQKEEMATGIVTGLEEIWQVEPNWKKLPDESPLRTHISAAWVGIYHLIHTSNRCNAIRCVRVLATGRIVVQYLTPENVWVYHGNICKVGPSHQWRREEAYPTTPETIDLLWPYMTPGLSPHQALETIFSLMHLVTQQTEYVHEPIQIKSITRTDFKLPIIGPEKYSFLTCTAKGHCLICPDPQEHNTAATVRYLTKKCMFLTCMKNKNGTHHRKIRSEMAATLFIERMRAQGPQKKTTSESISAGVKPKRTAKDRTLGKKPQAEGIRIMTWNADMQIKGKIKALMSYMREKQINVIGLQEVDTLPAGAEVELEKNGFLLYRHGNVAIMLHADTAGRLVDATDVWRSEEYNSMSITLTTGKGSLLLVTAYLPTGIDSMSEEEKEVAMNQHIEINARATKYEQAILMMDGNETAHTIGRTHIRDTSPKGGTKPVVETEAPETGIQREKTPESTTMGCYTTHMQIARSPTRGEKEEPPEYTNVQKRNGFSIHSEIDYIWISNRLVDHVAKHEADDAPRKWRTGKQNKNYHKAVSLELHWPNLWLTKDSKETDQETQQELEGEWIALGPDLRKANQETDGKFSQEIDKALKPKWKTLRRTFMGNLPPQKKLTILYDAYQNIHLKTAYKVYGQRKHFPARNRPDNTEATEAWDQSHKKIADFIKKHKEAHTRPPDGKEMDQLRDSLREKTDTLRERGHTLPPLDSWADLQKWTAAKDYNRGQMLGKHDAYGITDAEALANPKKLTKAVCKPPGSSSIHSLRKGNEILVSDVDLEKEFTSFLTNHGGNEEEICDMKNHPAREKNSEGKCRNQRAQLKGLVSARVELSEIQATLADLSNTVAAGVLPPHLVKTAATKPWKIKVEKSAKQKMREKRQSTWEEEMGLEIKPEPQEQTNEILVHPTRSIKLLRMVVETAFLARNIPKPEKKGIVTPLSKVGPKMEGPINSIQHIRPITVSPILGRIINNVLAKRLAGALEKHKILSQSQFAFLPGRNIHQAISSIKQCFAQSNRARNGGPGRACFAVFYDISKAYDTVKWSSIQNALINIGAPDDFIDFVMHSLQGTELCMKTNIPGRVTPTVEMHKAIKQGCPLAPILFTILMNDLHERCSKIGGYTLRSEGTTPVTIASRGFCDDTAIMAEDFETLQKLNHCVAEFFAEHGFQLSATKTYLLGREADGSRCAKPLYWPGQMDPINPKEMDYAIRYLGIWISLNLSWTTQIAKMTASIMGLVSHIKHRRITLLQAAIIIRYVVGKKMEIGFRHATIKKGQLQTWDRWLKDAVATRAEVPLPKLHSCSVMPILKTLDLERTYVLDKAMGILENLIKESDTTMQTYYQNCFERAKTKGKDSDKALIEDMDRLRQHGIHLEKNERWRAEERILRSNHAQDTIIIKGTKTPVRMTDSDYTLWGSSHKQDNNIEVVMCTDGSADPRNPIKRAGAAVVYMDDAFAKDEYDNTHQKWTIRGKGNYEAELAAINKAIRSIPVTTHAIIYTDSLSALMAIETFIRTGGATAPLACSARPYLRAAAKAKEARTKLGTRTIIRHVRAHTGARDPPSVGNEAADRRAKTALHEQLQTKMALQGQETPSLNLMDHELQYVVRTAEEETEDQHKEKEPVEKEEEEPYYVHGNIRRTLRNQLRESLLGEWAKRKVRGELVRKYRRGAMDLIDCVWKTPTSNKLTMLLDVMNQADTYKTTKDEAICGRCGRLALVDTTHRILTCPTVAEAWNTAELKAWEVITPIQDEAPISTTTFRAAQLKKTYHLDKLGTRKPLNPAATPFYPTAAAETKIALMMAHAEMDHITRRNMERGKKWAERAKTAAKAANMRAMEATDVGHKAQIAAAEALDLLSRMLRKPDEDGRPATYEKEASTLTRDDFNNGQIIAVVGRELTGPGPSRSNTNKEQESIHKATIVHEPGEQDKTPSKRRALRHHVWWGVVAGGQEGGEGPQDRVLLNWLCVTPQREGCEVAELGPSNKQDLFVLGEGNWLISTNVPAVPHETKPHTYEINKETFNVIMAAGRCKVLAAFYRPADKKEKRARKEKSKKSSAPPQPPGNQITNYMSRTLTDSDRERITSNRDEAIRRRNEREEKRGNPTETQTPSREERDQAATDSLNSTASSPAEKQEAHKTRKRKQAEGWRENQREKDSRDTSDDIDEGHAWDSTTASKSRNQDEPEDTDDEQQDIAIAMDLDAQVGYEKKTQLETTDNMARQLLRDKGLHMKDTKRDGHCLFTSVAELIQHSMTRDELRKRAVEYVLEHFEHFKEHLASREPKPYMNREEYRVGLQKDQGDEPELVALGHISKRKIILHELDEVHHRLHSFTAAEPEDNEGVIHLVRVMGNHFHAVTGPSAGTGNEHQSRPGKSPQHLGRGKGHQYKGVENTNQKKGESVAENSAHSVTAPTTDGVNGEKGVVYRALIRSADKAGVQARDTPEQIPASTSVAQTHETQTVEPYRIVEETDPNTEAHERETKPTASQDSVWATKCENISRKGKGITLIRTLAGTNTAVLMRPDVPGNPIGYWHDVILGEGQWDIVQISDNGQVIPAKVYKTNTRFGINDQNWKRLESTLRTEGVYRWARPGTESGSRTRGQTKRLRSSKDGQRFRGDETGRGYLYTGTEDPDPALSVKVAEWLPASIEGRQTDRNGLFTNKLIRKNAIITTYAGRERFIASTDIHHLPPEETSHYKTLTRFPHQLLVIDGFRTQELGFGLAQFCNDKREPKTANAHLVTVDAEGAGKTQGRQKGVYLKASRDIKQGEEILITYDKTFSWRPKRTDIEPVQGTENYNKDKRADEQGKGGPSGDTYDQQKTAPNRKEDKNTSEPRNTKRKVGSENNSKGERASEHGSGKRNGITCSPDPQWEVGEGGNGQSAEKKRKPTAETGEERHKRPKQTTRYKQGEDQVSPGNSAEKYGILQPKKLANNMFAWEGIAIESWKKGQARLVVTAEELLPGTLIPILGTLTQKGGASGKETHAYQNANLSNFIVDGHPNTDTHEGVGNRGLSIAMMANEPSATSKATATFTQDYLRIIKKLTKGDEITVVYATSAGMRKMRHKQGYTVEEDSDPKPQTSAYPDPGQSVRRYYTARWYAECKQAPRTKTGGETPPRIIRGISNIGNTCYLNATIQALLAEHSASASAKVNLSMEETYAQMLTHLTQNRGNKASDEDKVRNLLHTCQQKYGRNRKIGKQESIVEMIEDLRKMGPEEDRYPSVLHLEEFHCTNPGCLWTHGTAELKSEMIVDIPVTDSEHISLNDCIKEGERPTHGPHGYRCVNCNGKEITRNESYYPTGGTILIRLRRETVKGKRIQTCVIPPIKHPEIRGLGRHMVLTAIIRHREDERGMAHSTTLAKRADKWYEFDDTKVRELTISIITNDYRTHLGGTEQIFIYTHKKDQESTWTLPPEEEDERHEEGRQENPQSVPWPTPNILAEILQHRTEKGLPTKVGQEDIVGPTTQTICEHYSDKVFSAMNADTRKIETYRRAIKKATRNKNTMNIDLGCGANAILSKEILKVHGQCISIELNPVSANTAKRTITDIANGRKDWKWAIENIDAKNISVQKIRSVGRGCTKVRVYHEIFGFLASSEGAPLALQGVRQALETDYEVEMVPRYASTYFALTHVSPIHIPKTAIQVANPQMILAYRMPIRSVQLASRHHTMEKYDFNSEWVSREGRGEQLRRTEINIERDGELNSIIGYLAVDFGRELADRRSETSTMRETQPKGPSFTSCAEDKSNATNWPNPIILLQHPIKVREGDCIRLSTRAAVGTTSPSYTFTVEKKEIHSGEWGPAQTIRLATHELYPSFLGGNGGENIPRNCPKIDNPLFKRTAAWTKQISGPGEEQEGKESVPPAQTNHTERNQRLECGAGPRRKKKQTREKQIVIDIAKALETNRGLRKTPWYGTSMLQVVNHLLEEQIGWTNPDETPPYFCPEVENIMVKHLHLEGTVNEHIANVRVGSRWYSPSKKLTAMGAQSGELTEFIQEHLTWTHPRATKNERLERDRLKELIEAVGTSTRARVAGLFEIEANTLDELVNKSVRNIRACVITTFQKGTLPTKHPRSQALSTEMDMHRNAKTLRLILIEVGEVNPIDVKAISVEMQEALPGSIANITWAQTSRNVTTSCPRTPHTTHPTLAFLHPIQALIPHNENKSTLETHSRIAAALGIIPIDLDRQLRYHEHNLGSEGLQTWQRKELSSILRDTGIQVYEGYMKWIKKDKYGTT
jgi:exonuclease III